jgi:hypothetical protein
MAERKSRTVLLDSQFVRREASEAVRTFFRPVIGTYNLVREASDPDKRGPETKKVSGGKSRPR